MNAFSQQAGVLYLERDKFYFYGSGVQTILKSIFPQEAVKDTEVLNKDFLVKNTQSFIEFNKIRPSRVVFVLSDEIIFQKIFPEGSKDKSQEEIFLQSVPYEHTSLVRVKKSDKTVVMATNTDLFLQIKRAFEKKDFTVSEILPVSVFENIIIDPAGGLTVETAQYIQSKLESLKEFTFVKAAEKPKNTQLNLKISSPAGNRRAIMLFMVFIVLLGILFFMMLRGR